MGILLLNYCVQSFIRIYARIYLFCSAVVFIHNCKAGKYVMIIASKGTKRFAGFLPDIYEFMILTLFLSKLLSLSF